MRLAWGEPGSWRPEGGRDVPVRDLTVGDLIEVERGLWKVINVRDIPVGEWDPVDREHYDRIYGPGLHRKTDMRPDGLPVRPEAWSLRPVQVSIEPAEGGPRRPLRFRPYAFLRQAAYVIPAHHPVCAVCGELYPCKHLEIDEAATGALAELADLESVLPGCCWHCREPISGRQKFISFPGDNLLLPGGPPPAFHLRAGKPWCSSAARLYERRWVEADPARLPRLQCPGRLTRHVDGHECTAGARCPGAAADHPSQSNHTANAAYARDCGRCAAAVARRGATLPGGLS